MIRPEDFLRYQRQVILPQVGLEGQEALQHARILVVGAGGLGCPVLLYLAGAGLGTIGIADGDRVELSNLHRQVLHREDYIGQSKVASARDQLKALNSGIQYVLYEHSIDPGNASDIFNEYDLILDCSDNFPTRYLVNDSCILAGKPLIYASILGFEGQMAVFNHKGSKNLRDLFPDPPDPEDVPNCSLNGVLGTLPGVIGSMMAHEALKLLLGQSVLHNELVIFNTMNWELTKLRF